MSIILDMETTTQKTFQITTQAATRSKTRRTRTWTITAANADDAAFEARISHVQIIGWNGSVWITNCEEM